MADRHGARSLVATALALIVALGCGMMTEAGAQKPLPRIRLKPTATVLKINPSLIRKAGFLLLRAPDLVPAISGPTRVIQGQDIKLKVTVSNKGSALAPGSNNYPANKSYMVDIVLSEDSSIPVEWAIQPVYQGLTKDDFVEDMLMLGGRLSNTQTLGPGKQTTYTCNTHIPARTPPGIYYLGAVVDAGENVPESKENNNVAYYRIQIGAARGPRVQTPPRTNLWVMPYAVGNTTINNIKASGYTDYHDGGSGFDMVNAPFGSRLGFRHGYDSRLPNAAIAFYRWSYQQVGTSAWKEFTAPIGVHYEKRVGAVISFPVLTLGPRLIGGKNLYAFKPHTPPSIPGATTSWPATDWFGDIYSGLLDTRALNNGLYRIKLEVFNPAGNKVMPSASTFRFIVPTGVTAGGTITTTYAASTPGGAYVFALQVDNRACNAYIDPPSVGTTTVADECGFLLYNAGLSPADVNARVRVSFFATQPQRRGMFRFRIVRGINTASAASGEIAAGTAGVYSGDGNGHFQHKFMRTELLGPKCKEKAAFSMNLHVYAKATNGWHHRLSGLDDHFVRAFALAPK